MEALPVLNQDEGGQLSWEVSYFLLRNKREGGELLLGRRSPLEVKLFHHELCIFEILLVAFTVCVFTLWQEDWCVL